MNLKQKNNWRDLVFIVWPEYTKNEIEINFKGGMEKVLEAWAARGATTDELVQHLLKLERKDILLELKKKCPEIR